MCMYAYIPLVILTTSTERLLYTTCDSHMCFILFIIGHLIIESTSVFVPLRGLLILQFQIGLLSCHWHNTILICPHNSFVMLCHCGITGSLLFITVTCNGCSVNVPLTFSHALDCQRGGLATRCYNEVRDALGDLAHREVV